MSKQSEIDRVAKLLWEVDPAFNTEWDNVIGQTREDYMKRATGLVEKDVGTKDRFEIDGGSLNYEAKEARESYSVEPIDYGEKNE